jgi:ABC-type polysaccharide/polyol phosphate transport system ATPase subunit
VPDGLSVGQAEASPESRRARRLREAPVVIEVRDVSKTFVIPDRKVDTLKERVVHPLTKIATRELPALRDISFDVRQGEFFGIVGRNGSGKSTLLKILASIYRADHGTVKIAGRLAPFIELGIGFNPELTARENVALNGVMMGLSRREAASRLDAVLEFAELQSFVDLKLKNYSSGMMVRLAFSVMVQADPDVMLVDEVLAVGDAAFAQRCTDVFHQRRRDGRTLVLVTHDMATVQAMCDRAMVIHDGEHRYTGEPEEAAAIYYRLNFGGEVAPGARPRTGADVSLKVLDAWLEDDQGTRVDNVEQGRMFTFNLLAEARYELLEPAFSFRCTTLEGDWVFTFDTPVQSDAGGVRRGSEIRVCARLENPLAVGRYLMSGWFSTVSADGETSIQVLDLLRFFVYGTKAGAGSVVVETEVEALVESDGAI